MRWLRTTGVGVALGTLLALPLIAWSSGGLSPGEVAGLTALGLRLSVETVGWVLLPQLALALAIFSLFVRQAALRGAGMMPRPAPPWVDAAVESALLLGMLGTISGMVSGFVGLTPDNLEAGPLIHSLGTALRSSFVGFGIALVGVWTRVATPSGEGAAG